MQYAEYVAIQTSILSRLKEVRLEIEELLRSELLPAGKDKDRQIIQSELHRLRMEGFTLSMHKGFVHVAFMTKANFFSRFRFNNECDALRKQWRDRFGPHNVTAPDQLQRNLEPQGGKIQ